MIAIGGSVRDYTEVVHGADAGQFDALLVARQCTLQALDSASELDSKALAEVANESLQLALALTGQPFPQDPMDQLLGAVEAVLRSWNDDKASHYRRINGIDEAMGTAVTVQAMVFGNNGGTSGAGVGFTRDPATGENRAYLDFLFNAQGRGRRFRPLCRPRDRKLSQRLPLVVAELARIREVLEAEFHDMQDFEFTVENGRLYLLQTRSGKRTPWAALQIAVDMVGENLITPAQALAAARGYCARAARTPASGGSGRRQAARERDSGEHRRCLRRNRIRYAKRRGDGRPRRVGYPRQTRDRDRRCRGHRRSRRCIDGRRQPHFSCRRGRAPARQGLPRQLSGAAHASG
jgi:hypothetical protein